MAKIVTLKDNTTKEYIYPMSSVKSVIDENGNSVESLLNGLDEKIMQISSAYRILGVKDNISEVTQITSSKIGDVWYVKNAFDLGESSYPGGTSVLCISDTSPGNTGDSNWMSLGSMFDLSEYITETEAKEFATCIPVSSALDILE